MKLHRFGLEGFRIVVQADLGGGTLSEDVLSWKYRSELADFVYLSSWKKELTVMMRMAWKLKGLCFGIMI